MQLSLIDPRLHPIATEAMLTDTALKGAIAFMRRKTPKRAGDVWPYVEALCEIGGRTAWAVDDNGTRFVVVGGVVWLPADLEIAAPALRVAAREAFERLDHHAVAA